MTERQSWRVDSHNPYHHVQGAEQFHCHIARCAIPLKSHWYPSHTLNPGNLWYASWCYIFAFLNYYINGTTSEVKASACNAGGLGSIPGSGRSPGEGNDNPLQYSCLENPMDGGAWWARVYGFAKSRTQLSAFTSLHPVYYLLRLAFFPSVLFN